VDDITLTKILSRNQSSCLDVYLNALHQSVQFGCVVRQVSLSSECLCLPAVRFHSQHIRCVHCVLRISARQNNINWFMAIVQVNQHLDLRTGGFSGAVLLVACPS